MPSNNAQLDWDHLRVFLAIARTRRVAIAARRLEIEHTTVSRRLDALEGQIGTPLFYRTANGYLLTPAGDSILAAAETMERAALTLRARAGEIVRRPAGRVRLGIAPEFASDWLAPQLPAFRARYPEIALQVLVGTRTLDLSRGEAELALRSPRPHQLGLVTARIATAVLALYASRHFLGRRRVHITDARTASGLPLLIYTQSLSILQSAAWFQPVIAAGDVVLETNSTHTLLTAARASVGVAVLPRFVARNYPELVMVSEPVSQPDIWLVTHPEFRRNPNVRATADFLKEIAKGPEGLS